MVCGVAGLGLTRAHVYSTWSGLGAWPGDLHRGFIIALRTLVYLTQEGELLLSRT